jgi:hypothetical protein
MMNTQRKLIEKNASRHKNNNECTNLRTDPLKGREI